MPAAPGVHVSPIVLSRSGEFVVDGVPVTHSGVRAALWEGLRRGPEGWRVEALGGTRAVALEDVPWFVRAVSPGAEGLRLWMQDGSVEPLRGPLRLSREGVLYAPLRGELARFLRPAQAQVEPFLRGTHGEGPPWEIANGNVRVPVLPLEEDVA